MGVGDFFTGAANTVGATTGIVADGSTNDTEAIQALIDAAVAPGGSGVVELPAGVMMVDRIILDSGLTLRGAGMGVSILRARQGDIIRRAGVGTWYSNIVIEDLTLDSADAAATSSLVMEWVRDVTVRRVEVMRFHGWGMSFGAYTNGFETGYVAENILIEDCRFHTPNPANIGMEGLLIFNADRVMVRDCDFTNASPNAVVNGIGVYQITRNVVIEGCRIDGWARGIYYSISTDHTSIRDCWITNNHEGITGANLPDRGSFGYGESRGLSITGTYFAGNTVGARVGATIGAAVRGNTFYENENSGLIIDNGNAPASGDTQHIRIEANVIRNNNQADTFHALHPGLLFQGVAAENVSLVDNVILDDQNTPTQRNAITFYGAFTWDRILVRGGSYTSYSGASPVSLQGGAALGVNCEVWGDIWHPSGSTIPDNLIPTAIQQGVLWANRGHPATGARQVGVGPFGPGGQAALVLNAYTKAYVGANNEFMVTVDNANRALQLDNLAPDGQTAMWLMWNDGGTWRTERVELGADDSGGTGYRMLRLPN